MLDGTQPVYNLTYAYDALGNRTEKDDIVAGRITYYDYDTQHDPETMDWATRNNRLLSYQEYGPGGLERTVKYTYYDNGHASNITVKDEYLGVGDPNDYTKYYALRLAYASNRRLWLAVNETWRATEQDPFAEYAVNGAWEFRYDGDGRERYMARQWTTPTTDPNTWRPVGAAQWTDYRGSAPYGDYAVEIDANQTAVVTETRRFLFGLGAHGQETLGAQGSTVYLHGDLVGSTMLAVNAAGQVVETPVYTAFGEPVTGGVVGQPPSAAVTRYGYAGAWGYESGLLTLQGANTNLPPIMLQHVGERWYQPGIGRFVQRDPIGILGGMNTYLYCGANPLTGTDPIGLADPDGGFVGEGIKWIGGKFPIWAGGPVIIFVGEVVITTCAIKGAWDTGWWAGEEWNNFCRWVWNTDDTGWDIIFQCISDLYGAPVYPPPPPPRKGYFPPANVTGGHCY